MVSHTYILRCYVIHNVIWLATHIPNNNAENTLNPLIRPISFYSNTYNSRKKNNPIIKTTQKKKLKPKFNIYNLIPLRRHKHIIQNHPTSSKRPGLALGEHLGHCLGSPIKNRPQIFKINN